MFLFCERCLTERPTANILDTVQYIVLHRLFSTKVFLIKLFKSFEEQVEDFFNGTSDSLAKALGYPD